MSTQPDELHLEIVQATNLAAMDINGKSDPYVVYGWVDCGFTPLPKDAQRTKVVKKTRAPVWNEKASWTLPQTKTLQLEVWDADLIGSDELIGRITVTLGKEVKTDTSEPQHFNLWLIGAKPSVGELHFNITYVRHS